MNVHSLVTVPLIEDKTVFLRMVDSTSQKMSSSMSPNFILHVLLLLIDVSSCCKKELKRFVLQPVECIISGNLEGKKVLDNS